MKHGFDPVTKYWTATSNGQTTHYRPGEPPVDLPIRGDAEGLAGAIATARAEGELLSPASPLTHRYFLRFRIHNIAEAIAVLSRLSHHRTHPFRNSR